MTFAVSFTRRNYRRRYNGANRGGALQSGETKIVLINRTGDGRRKD